MGITGTAVTKNASDLVLMDDDFSTIVAAVREGRLIYSNMQKYTLAVLSVKCGECAALLLAISVGVPMPMTPIQQMYNMIITHIILKATIAFETAEEYIMKVPPRETKNDFIMRFNMFIWRLVPHVLFFTLAVHACLAMGSYTETGFVSAATLQGSSLVNALDSGRAVCEFAGSLDSEKNFVMDPQPFHCRCSVREHGRPWTQAQSVDQWGPDAQVTAGAPTTVDEALFAQVSTPWQNGTSPLLSPCADARGLKHYCWNSTSSATRPLLPVGGHCAATGTRRAQAMTFAAIQMMEAAAVLTMRRDEFSLAFLFSNKFFTGAVVLQFGLLLSALGVPRIAHELDLVSLGPAEILLAAFFALIMFVAHEVAKVFYRASVQSELPQLEDAAKRKSLAVFASLGREASKKPIDDSISETASSAPSRKTPEKAKEPEP